MHLYAYESSGQIIFCCHAKKKADYQCLECGNPVRLREGDFRTPHFYHLKTTIACRQNGKSQEHLQLQIFLKNNLPKKEDGGVDIECRFTSIGRIADVAWHSEKIIFEIQCSHLSVEEMEERVRDYQKIGYTVVWILHDSRYNQRRLKPIEMHLQDSPHYYTNMNAKGQGKIYDQWHYIDRALRKKSLPPLLVDLRKPNKTGQLLSFYGDIRSLPENHPYLALIKKYEKEMRSPPRWVKNIFEAAKQVYSQLINNLLRPYCD